MIDFRETILTLEKRQAQHSRHFARHGDLAKRLWGASNVEFGESREPGSGEAVEGRGTGSVEPGEGRGAENVEAAG